MKKTLFDEAKEYHNNLPEKYREYFNKRGLNNDAIDKNLLGYANIYGKDWLTIPIFSTVGEVKYFKLRRLPEYDKVVSIILCKLSVRSFPRRLFLKA